MNDPKFDHAEGKVRLVILHLSDLHLKKSPRPPILGRSQEIAATTFPLIRNSDACLILVTGDIAFSGSEEEFDLARLFLGEIRDAIEHEGCSFVDILLVPGNHDCKLLPENKARTVIIEQIVGDPELAEDPDCVSICVAAQTDFFTFRNNLTKTKPTRHSALWTDYEIVIAGKVIRISAINASWMSRLQENPGQLVFPTQQFQEWIGEPAEFRVAMVHHPLNWYSQSSYHALRSILRANCSLVLSGHEHVGAATDLTEFGSARQLVFEAPALQPHNSAEAAGFSVLLFDTDQNLISQQPFHLDALHVQPGVEHKAAIEELFRRGTSGPSITKDFDQRLRDPGGGFGHPDKEHLEIDDLFVFPELRIIERDEATDKAYSLPSEDVLFDEHRASNILLLGEEKSGKTTLLLRAFKEFLAQGLHPIYIQADAINSFSTNEIGKATAKATREQYENSDDVERSEKSKRVCLLDDLDRTRGGARTLSKLLHELECHFSLIIATASLGFEVREIINSDAANALHAYDTYEVCRFGNIMRHRLIRRWCLLGPWQSLPELDREVHAIEEVVNDVVSRTLAPSLPIYLLILLQSYSQQQQGELRNSGFARYYEYLMTRSLVRAGIKKDAYDELYNYLAQLAWLFQDGDKEEATRQELVSFTRVYSDRYFTVDLDARLDLLVTARLLNRRGDCFRFAYPYVYYFFLGRYLARNIADETLKAKVREWCQKLYLRKHALAIVFLSYHSNDEWIIDQISSILDGCFPDVSPIEYGTDIGAVNGLVDKSTTLLIAEPDVEKHQVAVRRQRDEDERRHTDEIDYHDDEGGGELSVLARVNLLLKAAEILGQITKNYYGSLERNRKEELLTRIIAAPLRMIRVVLREVAEDPKAFVLEMEKAIATQHNKLDPAKKRELARNVAFQLLGFICTTTTIKTAGWVGSERLEEDLAKVTADNPTVAFKLVEAGTRLLLPRELALDRIRKLADELVGNSFAFHILQAMGLRYLHLFHMKVRDRQQLCATLKIELAASKSISLKTKKTKLLR